MVNEYSIEQRIEGLIGIVVSHFLRGALDAGFHMPPQFEGAAIDNRKPEYHRRKSLEGLPKAQTADFALVSERCARGRADDKMIREVEYLKKPHHNYRLSCYMLSKLPEKYASAVMAESYMNAVYKREHREKEVAAWLGVTVRQYRHNREMANQKLSDMLVDYDNYQALA